MKWHRSSRRSAARSLPVWTAGPRHGVPVVLLHGFLSDHRAWRSVVQNVPPFFYTSQLLNYSQADMQAVRWIALDLPGHGDAAGMDLPDNAWPALATLLDATLAPLLHEPFVLAGYSMGGRVAAWWALTGQLPRHVGLRGLLLESAHPGLPADQQAGRQREDLERAQDLQHHGIKAFVDQWEQLPLFASQRDAREALTGALRSQRRIRLAQSPVGLAKHLRQLGTGTMPRLDELEPHPALPTVVLTGTLDAAYGSLAPRWQRPFPLARHVVADHAGHNVHLEQPKTWATALDSLVQYT